MAVLAKRVDSQALPVPSRLHKLASNRSINGSGTTRPETAAVAAYTGYVRLKYNEV